jgi:glycine/D-amino acid oxidase-like deaminating enzyme
MTSAPSVVVVGGGALGLCTALELTELGVTSVTVLEREHPAFGSSGLSVGIVETQYLDPMAIAIRVYGMQVFARLEKESDLEVTRNGYLRLSHRAADIPTFERSVEVQRELGVTHPRVLDREEIAKLVPDMDTDGIVGGLFGREDGYIDGHHYCAVMTEMIRRKGGTVLGSTALLGADTGPDGRHVLTTSSSTLECDVVVNAAGGWGGKVGDLLGTPSSLLPQRHRALVAHLPRALDYVMPSVMDYVPSSGTQGLYFRHESRDSLIAGLHTEEVLHDIVDPDDYGRGDDNEYMSEVGELFARRLPSLAGARLGNVWAGLYPMNPDGKPAIGPYRARPAVVAALGGGGSGLQASPGIGRIAAEWIVHGEPRTIAGAEALLPDRASLREEAPA